MCCRGVYIKLAVKQIGFGAPFFKPCIYFLVDKLMKIPLVAVFALN